MPTVDTEALPPLLPEEAQEWLREAAQTPPTRDAPLARQNAIDDAIAKVHRCFPQYFKKGVTQ
jgi:hypothetical protein